MQPDTPLRPAPPLYRVGPTGPPACTTPGSSPSRSPAPVSTSNVTLCPHARPSLQPSWGAGQPPNVGPRQPFEAMVSPARPTVGQVPRGGGGPLSRSAERSRRGRNRFVTPNLALPSQGHGERGSNLAVIRRKVRRSDGPGPWGPCYGPCWIAWKSGVTTDGAANHNSGSAIDLARRPHPRACPRGSRGPGPAPGRRAAGAAYVQPVWAARISTGSRRSRSEPRRLESTRTLRALVNRPSRPPTTAVRARSVLGHPTGWWFRRSAFPAAPGSILSRGAPGRGGRAAHRLPRPRRLAHLRGPSPLLAPAQMARACRTGTGPRAGRELPPGASTIVA